MNSSPSFSCPSFDPSSTDHDSCSSASYDGVFPSSSDASLYPAPNHFQNRWTQKTSANETVNVIVNETVYVYLYHENGLCCVCDGRGLEENVTDSYYVPVSYHERYRLWNANGVGARVRDFWNVTVIWTLSAPDVVANANGGDIPLHPSASHETCRRPLRPSENTTETGTLRLCSDPDSDSGFDCVPV